MKNNRRILHWLDTPACAILFISLFPILWLGLLYLELSDYKAVTIVAAVTIFFISILCVQVPKKYWLRCLQSYVFLLFFQSLVIILLQQFPQSLDVPPDSVKYHLHGEALALHWQGYAVDGDIYGLQLFSDDSHWGIDSPLSFPYVVGSTNFLYQAYIGFMYYFLPSPDPQAVILSHVAMLAAFPILTFLLAYRLFCRKNIAIFAALLVEIDLRFSVNAIWLLKDTLLTFFVLYFFVSFAAVIRDGNRNKLSNIIGMIIGLIAISCLRSHAAIIFWMLVTSFVICEFLYKKNYYPSVILATFISFCISGFFKLPVWDYGSVQSYVSILTVNFSSVLASLDIVSNSVNGVISPPEGTTGLVLTLDSTVESFYERLMDEPLSAIVQAASRTFFAPYPWVVFFHGFLGTAYDLYFPGMVVWVLSLPLFIVGIIGITRRLDALNMVFVVFVIVIVGGYIVSFGEFSTRQRQFLTPLFWIWISYGGVLFKSWLSNNGLSRNLK